jgi:type IV secretory pathway TrbD component
MPMKLLRGLLANVVICGFLLWLFDYLGLGIQISFVDGNLLVRIMMLMIMG